RPDDAVFALKVAAVRDYVVPQIVEHTLPVFRMQKGGPGVAVVRIVGTDAEDLVENFGSGPVAGSHIENVASDTRDALRFAQPMLACLQGFTGCFALGN